MFQTFLAQAQSAAPQQMPGGGIGSFFVPLIFIFHHHVLCDDPTAKKAAATATAVNFEFENRGPGRNQCRYSRFNLECEGEYYPGESSRQREDRNGQISDHDGAKRELIC
jgi:hypothetical protein